MRKLTFTTADDPPKERTTFSIRGIGPSGKVLSEELEEPSPGERVTSRHSYESYSITPPDRYLRGLSAEATISFGYASVDGEPPIE